MGCDYFYSGYQPDENIQEKIVNFYIAANNYWSEKRIELLKIENNEEADPIKTSIIAYFEKNLIMIHSANIIPHAEEYYLTCNMYLDNKTAQKYPFNYYGYAEISNEREFSACDQFIFDRSNNGKLIRLFRIPKKYGRINKMCNDSIYLPSHFEVVYVEGGRLRLSSSYSYALLLNIIQMRWWPDMHIGDDYCVCETVAKMITYLDLSKYLSDVQNDFPECATTFFDAKKEVEKQVLEITDQIYLHNKGEKPDEERRDLFLSRFWDEPVPLYEINEIRYPFLAKTDDLARKD